MNDSQPSIEDRLSIRSRPESSSVMFQSWEKLLFMHWPVPVEAIRPLIPERLSIDTFDGTAWVAITPFTIKDARPILLPSLPWISDFHEINVRTYVHLNGVPGVWFFSLDTNSHLAVMGARTFFHLSYFNAEISLEEKENSIFYNAARTEGERLGSFEGVWRIGPDLPSAEPGTLEFFLVERYCLYSYNDGDLYRSRIFHQPWPLQQGELLRYEESLLAADGIPEPIGEPLLHCGGPVHVEIWPIERV